MPLPAPTGTEMPHSMCRITGPSDKSARRIAKTPDNKTVPQRMVAEKILSADATTATIALAFSIINIRQVATVSFFH